MTVAGDFVKKLSRKNSNSKKIEKEMIETCANRIYGEPRYEQGWGEIEIWEFSDSSKVSYDGRGYIEQ